MRTVGTLKAPPRSPSIFPTRAPSFALSTSPTLTSPLFHRCLAQIAGLRDCATGADPVSTVKFAEATVRCCEVDRSDSVRPPRSSGVADPTSCARAMRAAAAGKPGDGRGWLYRSARRCSLGGSSPSWRLEAQGSASTAGNKQIGFQNGADKECFGMRCALRTLLSPQRKPRKYEQPSPTEVGARRRPLCGYRRVYPIERATPRDELVESALRRQRPRLFAALVCPSSWPRPASWRA